MRELLAPRGYRLYWHAFRHYSPDNYRGSRTNRSGLLGDVNLLALPPGVERPDADLPPATDFAELDRYWADILMSPARADAGIA